ncbi:MAG: alkaline phosphatase family protein [Actinomycetes bacterium]
MPDGQGEPEAPLPPSGWASLAPEAAAASWTRPLLRDLLEGLWSVLVAAAGVGLGLALVEGVHVEHAFAVAVVAVVAILVLDAVLNPLLRRLASLGSVVLALVLGVLAQLATVTLVLVLAPGVTVLRWTSTVTVILVATVVISLGRWLVGATDSGYVVGAALGRTGAWRRSRRLAARDAADPRRRGLLVVQLDGVSVGVLERAIDGGQAPNLARWLRHTHRLSSWWATVPSTTPAALAGILHGDDTQVPAFRWWDRVEGRLLAASKPADSQLVESRFRPGCGLLRSGGVAVSSTYSGEADRTYLTISQAVNARRLGPGRTYVSFFARPFLLPGALLLTVGEMVKEVYQGHRQRVRGVEPRISRRGVYVLLRGITNVLLRKLNLSVVAQQMAAGRPIIFVDFVDYDEIAHHAGPERPESMRALEGLDAVLGNLRHVAQSVGTTYELVVLSDHGQSLGRPFEDVSGRSLPDLVEALMDDDRVSRVDRTSGEEWGPLNALVTSVLSRWAGRWTEQGPDRVLLGPDRHPDGPDRHPDGAGDARSVDGDEVPQLAVTGGGNLGMVWFPRLPARPRLDDVDARWPKLVPGLLATPGIGLVMVSGPDGEPLVFGRAGVRGLTSGVLDGVDPLERYPRRTAADLRRLSSVPRCGDMVLISEVGDRGTVHAFEHQVGSHGGVGGPQNEAILVHPRGWDVASALTEDVDGMRMLVGPVALHRQLLAWRRGVGAGPDDGPAAG